MAAAQKEVSTTAQADTVPSAVEKQPEIALSADNSPFKDPVTEEKKPEDVAEKAENTPAAPTEALQALSVSEKKADDAEAAAPAPPQPDTGKTTPAWPEIAADHPLAKFFDVVEDLTTQAGHNEVYGIPLSKANEFHTKLILQKFLRANYGDLEKGKAQLLETLKWRREFDPAKAASEIFEKSRFGGLGYILQVEGVPESKNATDVVTFNIYGAVKDNKQTFGDLERFLRWRVGLMERSVQKLSLSTATNPIPDYNAGPDPYQGIQIHDYLQVSFLRQDPLVKAATKKTIEVLGRYYPETLSRKFFVNVPLVMGWMYQAVRMIVSKETAKKFTVLSYGSAVAGELGKGVPKEYGGENGALSEVGEAMKLDG